MKILACVRQYFIKRRSGNVEKLYIYTRRVKIKVRLAFLAPLRLLEFESV